MAIGKKAAPAKEAEKRKPDFVVRAKVKEDVWVTIGAAWSAQLKGGGQIWAAPAAIDSRIIPPPLDQTLAFCRLVSRATISPVRHLTEAVEHVTRTRDLARRIPQIKRPLHATSFHGDQISQRAKFAIAKAVHH